MSEAHENTRIRQLTDAAAHWEHKYANARQYNRNLEERIRELEAALRQIRETLSSDSIEYDDIRNLHAIIDNALPQSETKGEQG